MKNVRLGARPLHSKKSLKPEFFVRIFPKPCTMTKIQLSIGWKKKKIVSKWIRNPERSRCLKIHRSSLSDLKLLAKVPKNSSWGHGNLWNSGQSIKAARLKRGRWCTRGLHGVFAKPLEGSLRVIARDIRRSSWWWRWCVPSGRSSCVQAARTRKARTTSAARTIMHPRKTEH